MRKSHLIVGLLLVLLVQGPLPSFSFYSCRMDGAAHAECCCSSQECPSAESECSCCDLFVMEQTAPAKEVFTLSLEKPPLPLTWYGGWNPTPVFKTGETGLLPPAEESPPRSPLILLCVQRI